MRISDRREAVAYAIKNAEEGDIIVLAGKGHEVYQEIAGEKYPMSEYELVADAMKPMEETEQIADAANLMSETEQITETD